MGLLDGISDFASRFHPSRISKTGGGGGIGNGHGMVVDDDNMIVSKPAIVFHSSQIFFNFLAMACYASAASFQAKWKVGPSGLSGFALFISISGMFLSAFMLAVPVIYEKHDRLIRLARALKEVRVSFILTLTGVTASLLIAFIVTVSAWTEPGCKDPDKDPHKDLGDKFKQGLDSFCSAKKAGAIFSWLAFGFWAASLTLLILDWRSGRLTVTPRGPRDPPFQTPTQHHEDVEEGLGHEEEDEEEHDYMHVPRPTQPAVSSAAYTPNSRYEPPLGNDHNPNSPFADDNRYAGRPSMDAYGAFSDPAPSGFVQAQQQQQQEAPRISRTMQYADPYAAVRASVASSAAASTPPSYESYSLR